MNAHTSILDLPAITKGRAAAAGAGASTEGLAPMPAVTPFPRPARFLPVFWPITLALAFNIVLVALAIAAWFAGAGFPIQ